MRWWLLPLVLIGGCNRLDLGKYELLGDIRVLAMKAEPPEVSPGAAVTITPLVSDQNGSGRALTYTVEACVDPGLDLSADPTCAGRADRVELVSRAAVTGLNAPNYLGTTPVINVTVPAVALAGRSARDQHNGVAYLVFLKIQDSAGTGLITAFKKIIVSTRAVKNTSPVLSAAQVDGAAAGALPTARVALTPVFTGEPRESFQFLDLNSNPSTFQEEVVTTWFASDGEFDKNLTGYLDPSKWTPPATAPSGRQVTVVAVSRDRRGGEAFQILTF